MKISFLITPLVFLLIGSLVKAKSLEDYFAILDKHPSIDRVLLEKEALEFQAEGALGLPDPVLAFGVENLPISDPSFDQYLPSSKTAGISQSIPHPAARRAQSGFLAQSSRVQTVLAQYTKSRIYALFQKKLAQYHRIKVQLGLEDQKREIIKTLKSYYQGEVVAGQPVFQKTFTADLELSEVDKRKNDLYAEQQIVEAVFIQLVGDIPGLPDYEIEEKNWSGDIEQLYPVQIARQEYMVAGESVRIAGAAFKPDFNISATYKNREEGEDNSFDGDDWFSLQLRMSIPLWSASNQEPRLSAAKSRQRSAQYNLKDVQRTWRMKMESLESKKTASKNNIAILNNKQKALESSIEALKSTYESGQTALEPNLRAEIARFALLSQIARERELHIQAMLELSAHINEERSYE